MVKTYSDSGTEPEPPSESPATSEKEAVEKDKDKDKDTTEKPPPHKPSQDDTGGDSTHETDKHVDEPAEVEKDASHVDSSSSFCSGIKCRGSFAAAFVSVLFVGIFVGRRFSGANNAARYHGTELEVPTLYLDEDDAVDFSHRYHDNPSENDADYEDDEEDDVAEEGIGYQEDDELDPHEIA